MKSSYHNNLPDLQIHPMDTLLLSTINGFHGLGFIFGGQKLGYAFSAAGYKIQASKHYIESLPYLPKTAAS